MMVSLVHCRSPASQLLLHRYKSSTIRAAAARDRTIDFGRYKGRMLGTLPSGYLRWVSNNLRARDFEHWAKLADEVLADPIYRDRIEWEFAERLLNGDAAANSDVGGAVSELVEISQRFGWDNDDKPGWSRIDFGLLGTSKGGRIPRVSEKGTYRPINIKREEVEVPDDSTSRNGDRRRRTERRERLRMKRTGGGGREKPTPPPPTTRLGLGNGREGNDVMDKDRTVGSGRSSPFPGRETFLNKALNNRRRMGSEDCPGN